VAGHFTVVDNDTIRSCQGHVTGWSFTNM